MTTIPPFVKYPEIPHLMENLNILDGNVQVFEKLDGGNTQIRNASGRILCGSRANYLTRPENFRFDWFKDFNRWAMSNRSLQAIPPNLIIYGEFTSFHNLRYKRNFTDKFFLIDLYDTDKKRFLPYNDAKNIIRTSLDLRDVFFLEPLAKGKVSLDSVKKLASAPSEYSHYGKEGVVVKDYSKQRFAKLWRTSANPTREGLLEEISKTLLSLRNTENVEWVNDHLSYSDDEDLPPGYFLCGVYDELKRSGRRDVSLSEIGEAIKKFGIKV